MSNWGTLVRRIQEETHRYDPDSLDRIKRAICHAVDDEQYRDFYFNEATYDFATVAGTNEYEEESSAGAADGYPADFLKLREATLIVSSYSYGPVDVVPLRRWRKNNVSSGWQGYPDQVTWDREKLIFWPSPNGVYTITIDYTKNIGTPIANYVQSGGFFWSFTNSLDGTTMVDFSTNAWFVEGADLINEAAKEYLYAHVWKDLQEANVARTSKEGIRKRLIREGRASQTPSNHRKYF